MSQAIQQQPSRLLPGASSEPNSAKLPGLTAVQWLICAVAALGFAFDLYEMLVMPVVMRPALQALGGLEPGSREFNRWVGLLFYIPALTGGAFGLLGAYLTDLLGRRRVLVWSILLYAVASLGASLSTTVIQLLVFRSMTVVGVAVEYVAAVAWLAEIFAEPKRRESVLAYTQAAAGLGGLMATGGYYLAVTFAERLPAVASAHDPWRYALLFGLAPAIPLIIIRPFLPESPLWRSKRVGGVAARPSFRELFQPVLRKTTIATTILFACMYGMASGVLLQTPRIVPGLADVRDLSARQIEQTVGGVQFVGELGVLAGRLLFALMVVRIARQQRLARRFLVPGLVIIPAVYFFAARHGVSWLRVGIFAVAVLINAPISLLWNYMPRIYPTRLRGTGEGFAHNVGSRALGTFTAVLTTQLANSMPGASASTRLAHSAAIVALSLSAVAVIASFALREPESDQLPP